MVQFPHRPVRSMSHKEENRYRSLPPHPPLFMNSLASILKSQNLRPVFYPYLQIGRLLSNGKDTILLSPRVVFTSSIPTIARMSTLENVPALSESVIMIMRALLKTRTTQDQHLQNFA